MIPSDVYLLGAVVLWASSDNDKRLEEREEEERRLKRQGFSAQRFQNSVKVQVV